MLDPCVRGDAYSGEGGGAEQVVHLVAVSGTVSAVFLLRRRFRLWNGVAARP